MSDQKNVLLSKPGTVSAEDKQALREAGVLVVEIANPNDVKLLHTGGDEANRLYVEAVAAAIDGNPDHDQEAAHLMADVAMNFARLSAKR